MAFKKQLVTSCKQAIWGEILGGNAPNYAHAAFSAKITPTLRVIKEQNITVDKIHFFILF